LHESNNKNVTRIIIVIVAETIYNRKQFGATTVKRDRDSKKSMSHDSPLADTAKSGVTPSTLSAAVRIKQDYQNFLNEAQLLMPKVDQSLLLDILYYQMRYPDWEGSVVFRVVYPADLDINQKKEWIYQKYQRMSKVEEEKTLKFKAIRMSMEELGKMLDEDPDIQYVTGSATLTPTDSYSI
jgi:hypothetical protein